MSRISFFALRDDLLQVLEEIEGKARPAYTLAESYPSPTAKQFESASDIPGLGIADAEQTALCAQYLITVASLEIQSEKIHRWNGSVVYVVNQSFNPDSVILTAGGRWDEDIIIAGNIASGSKSPSSEAWMRKYRTVIKRRFTRINAFWVGPSALIDFRRGQRLTIAEQSPSEYDLREIHTEFRVLAEQSLPETAPLKVTSLSELMAELQENARKRRLQ